jgi:hypothetical protein
MLDHTSWPRPNRAHINRLTRGRFTNGRYKVMLPRTGPPAQVRTRTILPPGPRPQKDSKRRTRNHHHRANLAKSHANRTVFHRAQYGSTIVKRSHNVRPQN